MMMLILFCLEGIIAVPICQGKCECAYRMALISTVYCNRTTTNDCSEDAFNECKALSSGFGLCVNNAYCCPAANCASCDTFGDGCTRCENGFYKSSNGNCLPNPPPTLPPTPRATARSTSLSTTTTTTMKTTAKTSLSSTSPTMRAAVIATIKTTTQFPKSMIFLPTVTSAPTLSSTLYADTTVLTTTTTTTTTRDDISSPLTTISIISSTKGDSSNISVGLVVGSLLLIALLSVLIFWFVRQKKKNSSKDKDTFDANIYHTNRSNIESADLRDSVSSKIIQAPSSSQHDLLATAVYGETSLANKIDRQ